MQEPQASDNRNRQSPDSSCITEVMLRSKTTEIIQKGSIAILFIIYLASMRLLWRKSNFITLGNIVPNEATFYFRHPNMTLIFSTAGYCFHETVNYITYVFPFPNIQLYRVFVGDIFVSSKNLIVTCIFLSLFIIFFVFRTLGSKDFFLFLWSRNIDSNIVAE